MVVKVRLVSARQPVAVAPLNPSEESHRCLGTERASRLEVCRCGVIAGGDSTAVGSPSVSPLADVLYERRERSRTE